MMSFIDVVSKGGILNKEEFVEAVIALARQRGLRVETNRLGLEQICFNERSKKSLHRGHLERLYPEIVRKGLSRAEVNALIDRAAPGRPCTHRGMREIVEILVGR